VNSLMSCDTRCKRQQQLCFSAVGWVSRRAFGLLQQSASFVSDKFGGPSLNSCSHSEMEELNRSCVLFCVCVCFYALISGVVCIRCTSNHRYPLGSVNEQFGQYILIRVSVIYMNILLTGNPFF